MIKLFKRFLTFIVERYCKPTELKYKILHPYARTPQRATAGSAGLDLYAVHKRVEGPYIEYDTGVAVEIPEGYVGLLSARSSVSERGLMPCNGTGIIDSDYRGSLKIRFYRTSQGAREYTVDDTVAQLTVIPILVLKTVRSNTLSATSRGEGGFGSTDQE
jgi:dUTP pyrophosphatase